MNTILVAAILRLCFVAYGIIHDNLLEVKYTDVDYSVFTEAANHLYKGNSPYDKDTYKYTPLLAYLLIPNISVHILFGKVLFCVTDLLVAIVLRNILVDCLKCLESQATTLINVCWLFNPFTMTISSRGNAESIQILLVAMTLLLTLKQRHVLAGLFFGLSIHFKLYPVIYALPLLLFIGSHYRKTSHQNYNILRRLLSTVLCWNCVLFGVISLLTFLVIGFVMYLRHGDEFTFNTYLYHLERKDPQHNFSPYFYILQSFEHSTWLNLINKLVFLPQFVVVSWFGVTYHEKLTLACFLQTFAFVSLNKVCTSQYFIWYIGLLPLAYPYINAPLKKAIMMLACWLGSQGIWLLWAYLLEFKKYDVVLYVWFASLMFLVVNVLLMFKFIALSSNVEVMKKQKKHVVEKRKPIKIQ